jgi:uncharacterized membrane protein (UPF0136 family)
MGFARTKSIPSLVAGVTVGALYGYGGYRIQEGQEYGYEICAAASAILLASSAPRIRKGPVPAALSATSTVALGYYGKKVGRKNGTRRLSLAIRILTASTRERTPSSGIRLQQMKSALGAH